VFIEIDRLSRNGTLLLERKGPGMYMLHLSGKRADFDRGLNPPRTGENMQLSSQKVDRPSQRTKAGAACAHARVIDYEFSADGKKTGNLVCKECGAIILDEHERSNSVD